MEKHRARRQRGLDDERDRQWRLPWCHGVTYTYTTYHISDLNLNTLFTDKMVVFCSPPGLLNHLTFQDLLLSKEWHLSTAVTPTNPQDDDVQLEE